MGPKCGKIHQRPDSGRSFGFLGGHFHDNFGKEPFRRSIVNGILWTAGVALVEQPHLRYTSTVVNCPPQQLRIGLPVRLTWIERYGAPFPVFEPAEG